jgi:hypothetical protein
MPASTAAPGRGIPTIALPPPAVDDDAHCYCGQTLPAKRASSSNATVDAPCGPPTVRSEPTSKRAASGERTVAGASDTSTARNRNHHVLRCRVGRPFPGLHLALHKVNKKPALGCEPTTAFAVRHSARPSSCARRVPDAPTVSSTTHRPLHLHFVAMAVATSRD